MTTFGGGYIASGPAGRARVPAPVETRMRLLRAEGAGEVQTPVRGTNQLRVGDRIWFRPAKAGEQLERFDTLHVVERDRLVESVSTYRGEGKNFG